MSQKYTDARYPEKINDLIDNEGGLSEEGKKAIEESGVEAKDPRIPEITPEDAGKSIVVSDAGEFALGEAGGGKDSRLPDIEIGDRFKILRVNSESNEYELHSIFESDEDVVRGGYLDLVGKDYLHFEDTPNTIAGYGLTFEASNIDSTYLSEDIILLVNKTYEELLQVIANAIAHEGFPQTVSSYILAEANGAEFLRDLFASKNIRILIESETGEVMYYLPLEFNTEDILFDMSEVEPFPSKFYCKLPVHIIAGNTSLTEYLTFIIEFSKYTNKVYLYLQANSYSPLPLTTKNSSADVGERKSLYVKSDGTYDFGSITDTSFGINVYTDVKTKASLDRRYFTSQLSYTNKDYDKKEIVCFEQEYQLFGLDYSNSLRAGFVIYEVPYSSAQLESKIAEAIQSAGTDVELDALRFNIDEASIANLFLSYLFGNYTLDVHTTDDENVLLKFDTSNCEFETFGFVTQCKTYMTMKNQMLSQGVKLEFRFEKDTSSPDEVVIHFYLKATPVGA